LVFVWAQGQKEKRYCWAHKRKAVFLGTQKREKVFDPRAAKLLRHKRKAVLLGTQKKSGISGHPKEKRYLIREPLSYSGPKRKAVTPA
jgi:hypothetical protein